MKLKLLIGPVLAMLALSSCSNLQQTTQLVEGGVVLDIAPVQVDVEVDTTKTLQGVSKTLTILGVIRIGDNKFADYPGMVFVPGSGRGISRHR